MSDENICQVSLSGEDAMSRKYHMAEAAITSLFGESIHIVGRQPVYGGDINRSFRLSLSDGTSVFMKCNEAENLAFFECETEGLNALRRTETVGVPKPLAVGVDEAKNISFLLMEYLTPAPRRKQDYWETLGHELAQMHRWNADERFRRWVLSCMISNTYYHNFVTHLLEAAYQREVYKIVDAGGSVQAEILNRIMRETLEKFWGEDVELTEGAELTWMRQPHYYMQLYSYTYSAGLTIGTQMCRRIETEGETAVEDWKKALAAGGTLSPQEFAAVAGVNLTSEKPLMDTIAYIGEIIDEIIELTDELEQA